MLGELFRIGLVLAVVMVPSVLAIVLIMRDAVRRGRVLTGDVVAAAVVVLTGPFGAAVYLVFHVIAHVVLSPEQPRITAETGRSERIVDLGPVEAAYRRAWAKTGPGANDEESLLDELEAGGVGEQWTSRGRPEAELVLANWRAGATPAHAMDLLRHALEK